MYNDDDMYDDDMYGDDIFLDSMVDLESMAKITSALQNLIDYSDRIYDLTVEEMCELESLRLQNSKRYEECLKKLKILRTKEQRILDNIGDSIDYEDFEEEINALTDRLIGDHNKREVIKQRINYEFERRAAENNAYGDKELSREFSRNYYYVKETLLNFMLRTKGRAKNTPRILQYKYKQAFVNRDIEIELLYAGYNLENIVKEPEENKHQNLNIDLDMYREEKEEFYYDFTIVTIKKLINQAQNPEANKSDLYNVLDLIKFLLQKVVKEDLPIILEECENLANKNETITLYDNVTVIDKLIELCKKETSKYELKEKDNEDNTHNEENKFVESLSEELIDNLFKLIKQVNHIYDVVVKMCILEIKNKKNTQEFESLLNDLENSIKIEKEIVKQIEIAGSEKDVVIETLNTSINIIAGLNSSIPVKDLNSLCNDSSLSDRNNSIRQRILNLIPDLYLIDNSVYKSPDVPLFIMQSQLIEVMKEFEKNINESKNKVPLIAAKYEQIFTNDDLTDDFVKAHGKIEDIISFDDETLATLLGIDLDEYKFDKSELLYNYITLTVEGLMENPITDPTPLDMARIEFQGLFINIAANSVQDGQVEIIYEDELTEEELEELQKIKKLR